MILSVSGVILLVNDFYPDMVLLRHYKYMNVAYSMSVNLIKNRKKQEFHPPPSRIFLASLKKVIFGPDEFASANRKLITLQLNCPNDISFERLEHNVSRLSYYFLFFQANWIGGNRRSL